MTENSNTPSDPEGGAATPSQPPATPAPGAAAGAAPGAAAADSADQAGQAAQASQVPQGAQAAAAQPGAVGAVGATAAASGTEADPWIVESDEEADYLPPQDPNAPGTGIAATFLPGIDATAVLALLAAVLGAGAYLLVYPLVQAHGAARTWSDFKNNVPRAQQDPFGAERDWIQYQSWTHIILGLLAILLALLVLGLWTAQRNKLHSRAFAQAALVLGLAVVLYGILLKTGVVGSEIPSMKEIGGALSQQQ